MLKFVTFNSVDGATLTANIANITLKNDKYEHFCYIYGRKAIIDIDTYSKLKEIIEIISSK